LLSLAACSGGGQVTPPDGTSAPSQGSQTTGEAPTTAKPVTLVDPWARTYGGNEDDAFSAVVIADNGDIIAAGTTSSVEGDFAGTHGPDNLDALLARFTPTGDLVWAHTYGGSDDDYFASVAIADNGDIIVAGYTYSLDGDFPSANGQDKRDAVIARYDPTGDVNIWTHILGGTGDDYFREAKVADNGEIIVIGFTNSTDGDFPSTHEQGDGVIVRFAGFGNIIWAHAFSDGNINSLSSLALAGNGDIIIAGATQPTEGGSGTTHGGADALITRFTSTGDVIWTHNYGGNTTDYFSIVALADNGDIVITGYTNSTDGDFPSIHGDTNHDAVVGRFTSTGDIIWVHTLGGNSYDLFTSGTIADNGDIIATGNTLSSEGDFITHGSSDALIARFTGSGDLLWAKVCGGGSYDTFMSVAVADDGDIVAVGYTKSPDGDFPATHGEDNQDALVARFTEAGSLT
jgi:hypothetical protein